MDKPNDTKNKKVLILSCGTGGGHNSAAKAIEERLNEKGIQADFKEYLEIINPRIKIGVNKLYLKSTIGNGKIFKRVYKLGELYQKTKLKSPVYKLNSLSKNKLYNYILDNKYDYIVTTHLFAAQALTAIKKEHEIFFMEIATDYVCVPFWDETNPDYFVIPSEELKRDFVEKGIKEEVLLPFGIPVSEKYSKEYNIEETKKELGLNLEEKYILILNGSMGFGNVIKMLKELLQKIDKANFIVSCGTNTKLLKNIQREYKNNNRIVALPYCRNLNKYMACSEIVLTKPGGLTSTEVTTIRKPLIHTMPIPGCENYNANFFEKRGMSLKSDNILEVVENTKELLNNKNSQKSMIENQEKYIDKDALEKICNFIVKQLIRGEI